MESYELDTDKIIDWALNYAEYLDLEKAAKGLYSIYVQQRKDEYPEEHKKNKQYKNSIRKQKTSRLR